MDNCIFCKIIKKESPAHIIRETDNIIVFLSLEGHPMIVPKKHIENICAMDDQNAAIIMQEAVLISKALSNTTDCEGINLVQSNGTVAGQDVFHFHLHIKPRWKDDEVILSWNNDTISIVEREILATKLLNDLDKI